MRTSLVLIGLMPLVLTGGCTAVSAVGAVGSTITNAAYNEAERRNRSSYVSPEERRMDIAQANLQLGIAYMQNNQFDKALFKLERALQARDDYAPVYNALGLLYRKMGQDDRAEEHFRHALRLDPADSSILNNYGLFLCENDRYAEAEEQFLNSANNPLYQTPEIALTNAGTCAMENRDIARAEEFFISALNWNVNIAPALIQMAEISHARGDDYEARKYLERFKNISAHTPKSLLLGVQIEQELGNLDGASSYALLLKNRYPDTEEAAQLSRGGI